MASSHPQAESDDPRRGHHPAAHARATPNAPACITAQTGAVTTYRDLDAASNQSAHLFRARGLKPGDAIVLFCQNDPLYYELVWGAHRAGLYYVPVSWHSKPEEIAYIIENAGAKAFIASARFSTVAQQTLQLIASDILAFSLFADIDRFEWFEEVRADLPQTPIEDETAGREMLYTSGTTGRPKGVKFPLSDAPIDYAPAADLFYQAEGYRPGAVILAPGPAYHASPLLATLAAHRFGAAIVIVDKFDAEEMLRFIEDNRVTHIACVPAHFVRLLKLPDDVRGKYDISSVQWIVHTAAPCPVDVKHAIIDWFGPIVLEVYSGTERVGGSLIRCEDWLQRPGSIGKAPNGAAHVVDEASWEELPAGETGVIYFETNEDFSYHGDAEKTKSMISPQGWKTLGDIGHIDADGYIYLTDRKSNMIISGGVNVYPQESENRLITHPKVADVAVFGIPNEAFGEEVKAMVQLAAGVAPAASVAQELIDYCKDVLASYKCPRSVDFVDRLPREDNGKIYKKRLLSQYQPSSAPPR